MQKVHLYVRKDRPSDQFSKSDLRTWHSRALQPLVVKTGITKTNTSGKTKKMYVTFSREKIFFLLGKKTFFFFQSAGHIQKNVHWEFFLSGETFSKSDPMTWESRALQPLVVKISITKTNREK